MVDNKFCGNSPSFFLGANTPEGFKSLFSELYDPEGGWRLFILKGGPGTGKSSVMKKVAGEADKRGIYCQRIYCSSDPESLDGVIIPSLKTSIADGTAPHVIEPKFPGVSEKTLDLGQFRNDRLLRENSEEIISLTLENSAEHKKCVGFLRAAFFASTDNRLLLLEGVDTLKLRNFAVSLADKIICTQSSQRGSASRRFLSALTPQGETIFSDSIGAFCEKRIILDDPYGVCAPVIVKIIAEKAAQAGLGTVECPCPMSSGKRLEHLLIPELNTAVLTSNKYHSFDAPGDKPVHCMRFCRPQVLREHRNRISFNCKARDEFIAEAVNKLQTAKALHDELEKYYITAMDFSGVQQLAQEVVGEVLQ